MKKVFGVLLMVPASLFLFFFILVLLASAGQMDVATVTIFGLLLLLPAALFFTGGVLLIRSANKAKQTPQSLSGNPIPSQPSDGTVINLFDRGNGPPPRRQTTTTTTTTTFRSEIIRPSTGEQREPQQGAVTVDCPGCGSKKTLSRNQSDNCDYCGTLVTYK